jgi:hypothetical protein
MKPIVQTLTRAPLWGAVALLVACAAPAPVVAPANDPVTLRVNVFRGGSNIPIYMGLGMFKKNLE